MDARDRPRADAIVTRTPRLAIGVSTADCGPLLFADAEAGVIGAAHAGWRGALTGVIEATVAAMEKLGAERARIAAALGPAIRQPNYEVGPEFVARFVAAGADNARFFAPSERAGHAMFDLAGYIADRVQRAGIVEFRGPRPVQLCRARALLQLPPHHQAGRARLRPAYQRHRARRLTRLRTALRLDSGALSRYVSAQAEGLKEKTASDRGVDAVEFGRARPARRGVSVSARCAVGRRLRIDARRLQPRRASDRRCRRSRAAPRSPSNPSTARRPAQFRELVQALNNEAQTRRLAVMSRESPSAYRVRGYLAARVVKRRDHDLLGLGRVRRRRPPRAAHRRRGDRQRQGRRTTPGPSPTTPCCGGSPSSSMDQLAAFLTSPDVAPGTARRRSRSMALAATADASPEAAGIFRIFQPNADPAAERRRRAPARPAPMPPVPLPPRRPPDDRSCRPATR